MLQSSKTLDEQSAIALAKEHLVSRYPKVVNESEVNAERVAGEKRERQLAELAAFVQSQGESNVGLEARFGLDEDHWLVRFFVKYPEGTASTIPPTMVRVYESDHRVEMATD